MLFGSPLLRSLFLLFAAALPLAGAACDGGGDNNDDDGPDTDVSLAAACGQIFDVTQVLSSRCFYDTPLDRDFRPSVREAFLRWCSNNYGLPGAGADMAAVLSRCAARVDARNCDGFATDDDLNCPELNGLKGSLKAGEGCEESLQCESGSCSTDGEGRCGVCARAVGEGESCAAEGVTCGPGLRCASPAGQQGNEVCQRRATDGEACEFGGQCSEGLTCDGGTCRPADVVPQPGEPCARFCAFGSTCVASTCVALPLEGAPCLQNDDAPNCALGLACDEATKLCQRRFRGELEVGAACGEGDYCKSGFCTAAVCVAYAKLGEACSGEGADPRAGGPPNCEDGYECRSGTCAAWTPACASP